MAQSALGYSFYATKPMSRRTTLCSSRLEWSQGCFTNIVEPSEEPAKFEWLLPPLFDPQVNGFAGVDYQQDNLSVEQLLSSVHALRRHGCSQILLTLITDEWPKLMKRLARVKKMRDSNPELRDAIAGWHIEGPFLSEKPGFCGAHPPELMIDPTPIHIDELRDITGNDPVLLTVAPERPGAIKAIERAVSSKIVISLGHTDASSLVLDAAISAGAKGFTHLGNGCPRTLDRQDNILWRVLNKQGLVRGLIPDGIHVTKDLFNIAHTTLQTPYDEGIYYTTDAMAAAGAPPGTYSIGRLNLEVGSDGVVRLPGQNLFAGSALTPMAGLYRAAAMQNDCDIVGFWDYFSTHARKMMGLETQFKTGMPADFCKVLVDEEQRLISGDIYIRGEPTPLLINPTH
jgi:N-acetylglucosamine-6-phosphate deacetylase